MKAVKLVKSYIDTEYLLEHQQKLLQKQDYTEGAYSEEFADMLAKESGFKYCELFASASVALYAAVYTAKQHVSISNPVQVPSFSFPALYNELAMNDLPVDLIDVDATGLAQTTGELTVHQSAGILSAPICKQGISIEDSAWCLGRTFDVKPTFSVNSLGNYKLINCGTGGALFFDDEKFLDSIRLLKYYGATNRATLGGKKVGVGSNMRFDDWRAVLGLSQMQNLTSQKKDLCKVQNILGVPGSGYSSLHLLPAESKYVDLSRSSWQPLHTYLTDSKNFPNSEHLFNHYRVFGSNIDFFNALHKKI